MLEVLFSDTRCRRLNSPERLMPLIYSAEVPSATPLAIPVALIVLQSLMPTV